VNYNTCIFAINATGFHLNSQPHDFNLTVNLDLLDCLHDHQRKKEKEKETPSAITLQPRWGETIRRSPSVILF
jgi:hypothetical protein